MKKHLSKRECVPLREDWKHGTYYFTPWLRECLFDAHYLSGNVQLQEALV